MLDYVNYFADTKTLVCVIIEQYKECKNLNVDLMTIFIHVSVFNPRTLTYENATALRRFPCLRFFVLRVILVNVSVYK